MVWDGDPMLKLADLKDPKTALKEDSYDDCLACRITGTPDAVPLRIVTDIVVCKVRRRW